MAALCAASSGIRTASFSEKSFTTPLSIDKNVVERETASRVNCVISFKSSGTISNTRRLPSLIVVTLVSLDNVMNDPRVALKPTLRPLCRDNRE